MTHSTMTEIPDYLAAEIASADQFRLLEIASRKTRVLALLLRGGRKASPNVEKPLSLARELVAWLHAVQDKWPLLQRAPTTLKEPESLPGDIGLPALLSAAGSDVRYLEHLTRGGLGMSPNMVVPLRIIDALITKLQTIHARWPELQGNGATVTKSKPRPRGSRLLDEMVASGEVNLHPDPIVSLPLDKLIADAQHRLGGPFVDHQ